MVIDNIAHAGLYRSLGARFAAGLEWLRTFRPTAPDGTQGILGEDVFALVQSYETVPAAAKSYEAHRQYADIQYVATGTELIHYAPVGVLQPVTDYDDRNDCLLFADPVSATPLLLVPGSFAIFWPQDGHKPGCVSGAPCRMKKVVIKVRV